MPTGTLLSTLVAFLLAVGFTGADSRGIFAELFLPVDERGCLARDDNYRSWWLETPGIRESGFDAPLSV